MIDFFLQHGSYFGITFILILSGAGLPVPEEVPVFLAGVLSSNGTLDPTLAFLSCLIGALLGDTLMYWIGHHFGRNILRKQGWWARVIHPEREAKIERAIQDHGLKVLFLSRFVVGLRSPIYVAAGILRVPYRRFLLMDALCATTVVGTFFLLSYLFGQTITDWIRDLEYAATAVVVLGILVAVFWYRYAKRKVKTFEANGNGNGNGNSSNGETAPTGNRVATEQAESELDKSEKAGLQKDELPSAAPTSSSDETLRPK